MSRNDEYIADNLLDISYHQNYYKCIGIDLWRQINTSILQEINFVGKLEEDDCTTIIFYCCKAVEKNSKLFFRFINCYRIM